MTAQPFTITNSDPILQGHVPTTLATRKRITEMLLQAKLACSRPLFVEISLKETTPTANCFAKKLKSSSGERAPLRWEDILSQMATLLPFMKSSEIAQIFRYASIYLLGFLVPTSSGNDFFTLQFQPHRQKVTNLDVFVNMDLEERLESTCRFIAAHEVGEFDVCLDTDQDIKFVSFLHRGLAPLLAGISAHEQEIDLYHIIAMIIAPTANPRLIPKTTATLHMPSWIRAQRLMKSPYSHAFQIHYSHRVIMLNILCECLVIPEAEPNSISCPLMDGAISHLRAAVHSFSLGAIGPYERHLAHRLLVQIALQTGLDVCVKEEWDYLLERTLGNSRLCKCARVEFCSHASNGNLLEHFIACYNGSRHYADENFTRMALKDLSQSILLQVNLCRGRENFDFFHTCRLASLLKASRPLFLFLLNTNTTSEEDNTNAKELELNMRENIMKASIQLIQHPDGTIAASASRLLALAFSYLPIHETRRYFKTTFESVKIALNQSFAGKKIELLDLCPVYVVASRRSGGFAVSLLEFLTSQRRDCWTSDDKLMDKKYADFVAKSISCISLAQPTAIMAKAEDVLLLFQMEQHKSSKQHLSAAILSTRRAYFFAEQSDAKYLDAVVSFLPQCEPWTAYKMGRHALVTGNFHVASELYSKLSKDVLHEKNFLWMLSLSKIAEAESSLLANGAQGITQASTLLESGMSYLDSMSQICGSDANFSFQIEFLFLRIDFLDLVSVVRMASQEARFTGGIPKVATRTGLHLINALNCFLALSSRYHSLYQRHGMIMCQASRTCLRTLYATCRYIGKTGNILFSELSGHFLAEPSNKGPGLWPLGDQSQSVTLLLKKFDDIVVNLVDKSMDPSVRAKVMIDILEGILRVPIPFPKFFLTFKSIPESSLQLSVDLNRYDDIPKPASLLAEDINNDENDEQLESISVYPGAPIPILAIGQIAKGLQTIADRSFFHLLIWTRFHFVAALHTTDFGCLDDIAQSEEHDFPSLGESVKIDVVPPFACQIPPSGSFVLPIECQVLRTEGIYRLDIQLGCRDVSCGEWVLPIQSNEHQSLIVKVSRSRD